MPALELGHGPRRTTLLGRSSQVAKGQRPRSGLTSHGYAQPEKRHRTLDTLVVHTVNAYALHQKRRMPFAGPICYLRRTCGMLEESRGS